MHIFITGGTGLVGSSCVRHLLSLGHTISALARSHEAVEKLSILGATPIRGGIADHGILASASQSADTVVYCAYDHSSPDIFGAEAIVERDAIRAVCEAVIGSGKMVFYCSGTGWIPPSPITDETMPIEWFRSGTDAVAEEYAQQGVRMICIRLASVVHSPERVPPFVKTMYGGDFVGYYGDGSTTWPAVHPDDAARLLGLVLASPDKLPVGRVVNLHAYTEKVSSRDIAEALGQVTGLPVRSFTEEEMEGKKGFVKMVLTQSPGVVNDWTRTACGWDGKGNTLLEDVREGKYFDNK